MCGIFAYAGNSNKGQEIILAGLKSLEYRGYDSWGIAVRGGKSEKIHIKKSIGKIGNANVDSLPNSSFGFGHTRWATHGGVTNKNAHPHQDCSGSIVVIHNGIVENYQELKEKFKDKHAIKSQTDTEVIAHLIEEKMKELPFKQAVKASYKKLKGLSAIIVFHKDLDQFIAIRKGSPLVIGFSKESNFISSDAAALLPHTKKVYFMEDNDLAVVSEDGVAIENIISGKKIIPTKQILKWDIVQASKGKFDHFMIKEIHEQPKVISQISQQNQYLNNTVKSIKKSQKIYTLGCGTASYAAIAGQYIFSHYANMEVQPKLGSEFVASTKHIDKNSLVMALSQSGETMDTLEAIRFAQKQGSKVASLVNVVGSTLYRRSDNSIPLLAGPEKAVASTKALISMVVYLFNLSYLAAGKSNQSIKKNQHTHKASQEVLEEKSVNTIKKLASKLKDKQHIYLVGRGISYPAALEIALKIKEISYIHAEGFAAGELKHGVIALIEKGTPCIVFAPNDELLADNISAAMELKARGAYVIGISPQRHQVFNYHLPVPDIGIETFIPNIIVGQLLSYYLATKKGLDPDMPRNLAKSVTVK